LCNYPNNWQPKKSKDKLVTEAAWLKAMSEIKNRSINLLSLADSLLPKIKVSYPTAIENSSGEILCAGLYSYSVEEYGKLLLLKKYQPNSGIVKLKYESEFRDHDRKFRAAINSLPNECTNFSYVIFDPQYFDPKIFDTNSHKSILDFEARLSIFYTDFNQKGDGLIEIPYINRDRLKKAISILRDKFNQTIIP
jgi:hypothetical protein